MMKIHEKKKPNSVKVFSMITSIAGNQTLQHAWEYLPKEKLLTTAKVVCAAIILYKIYSFYQSYQSLLARVQQLEADQKKPNPLLPRIVKLEGKLQLMKQDLKYIAENLVATFGSTPQKTSLKMTSLEETPLKVEQPSHLDLFKQSFPGQEIEVHTKTGKTTFANFILKTLLRVDEKPECQMDSDGNFTLTFELDKWMTITKIPEVDDPNKQWIKSAVEKAIYAIGNPQIQISQVIKGRIIKTDSETTIELDETSIFLIPKATYKGHFKKITVLNQPNAEGHLIVAEGEHNSWALSNYKGGSFHHAKFIELIELNTQ